MTEKQAPHFKIGRGEKILWASIFISGLYLLASTLMKQFGPYIQSVISFQNQ